MIKIFVSDKCPDCMDWMRKKEQLPKDIEWINITDSMKNLKDFLVLRDTQKDFEKIRAEHRVGIPMVYKDGKVFFPENIEEIF